jgi:hypothetical protein
MEEAPKTASVVALANQYAGVELTGARKQLKRKVANWHPTNCIR